MTDGARPTSTDLMVALEDVKRGIGALRTDVSGLVQSRDDHAAALDHHGRRLGELESQHRQHRELVTRLHERLAEVSGKVTAVLDLSEKHEEITRNVFRTAVRELSSEVTALVRAELSGLRADLGEIAKRLDTRPCVASPSSECPIPNEIKE
jgi:DNA repair ATPase RecN